MAFNYTNRLSELDWLRVILILAVFLHHVCMPFNGDGWHIMNDQSSKTLDDIMVYFEQIRLPILFFIAGAGSVLLLSKVSVKRFAIDKALRLFIPLLIGSLLIIPPQSYIENIDKYHSYWQAFPELALNFESNHLWFIEFLILFALLAIPINALLKSSVGRRISGLVYKLSLIKGGLFIFVVLISAVKIYFSLMFPKSGNGIGNLSSSMFYLLLFIAGMIFIRHKGTWQAIGVQRFYHLIILAICTLLFYGYYYSPDLSDYLSLDVRWAIWWTMCCLVTWSALLTLVGYSQHYLTQTPKWLKLCNELIYPFYIFHQTVIVVVGYYVIHWQASITIKIVMLLSLSLLITSAICFFIVKPFNIFRLMFGLKPIQSNRISATST